MMHRVAVILVVAAVVVAGLVGALYLTGTYPFERRANSSAVAPNFALADIYGHNFTLDQYRNSSVVVIEFTALSCSECQITMQQLRSLYAGYNSTGTSKVQVISIYTEPSFGDTISALRSYHTENDITWTMAQDTKSLTVQTAYGIEVLPTVVIVDKQGHPVYDSSGAQNAGDLQATVNEAVSGKAATISLVTVSVFALAAIAGVSTFFSPCAFPMFPGYMGLFLGMNTSSAEGQSASGGTYKGAVRRALSAGSVAAVGMVIVFLLVGLVLLVAANAVGKYIPDLLIVVGAALVGLGALLLTNLQYWRIVTPLQRAWARLRGSKPSAEAVPVVDETATTGRAFYLKLFSYGMGYAAAAAGCVAPVIISAIVAGLALGLIGGIVNILIYSLTAACLMIAVTLIIALAGKRYVNQLKAYTPLIKKVSAGVLVIVGVYLIYFYYTAWIV